MRNVIVVIGKYNGKGAAGVALKRFYMFAHAKAICFTALGCHIANVDTLGARSSNGIADVRHQQVWQQACIERALRGNNQVCLQQRAHRLGIGARRFGARRERTFFSQTADAVAQIDGQPVLPPNMLSVGSSFFIVRGMVRFDRVEASSETLLERKGSESVEIVWQQRY